jgi:hypothetical protein
MAFAITRSSSWATACGIHVHAALKPLPSFGYKRITMPVAAHSQCETRCSFGENFGHGLQEDSFQQLPKPT